MMNTAYALWTPLQGLLRWLAPAVPRRPAMLEPVLPSGRRPALAAVRSRPIQRPLRVVRVMEAGQVGRMVISGRMADVCAELDRLAACEAARH
jgi:hypothetical protein